jgi:hypothetical protein
MKDFENLWIWRADDLHGRLHWYRHVATNQMPAKFRWGEDFTIRFESLSYETSLMG